MSHPTHLPPDRLVCRDCFYTVTQRCLRCPNPTLGLRMLMHLRRHWQVFVVLTLPPTELLGYSLRQRIADSGTAVLLLRLSKAFWKMTDPVGSLRRLAARLPVVAIVRRIVSLVR